MDQLIQLGVQWIISIQSLGGWLKMPMQFFTFLGSENFFYLVLPLIYWSIDAVLGLRVGFILIASASFNSMVKAWFAGPRPYWISDKVISYSVENSFGVPSGHAQNAVSVWGMIAASIRKPWAWVTASALVFLIGFSRWYLGMHFIHDGILGWLIGILIVGMFIRFGDAVAAWFKTKSLGQQIGIAFAASILLILLGWGSSLHLTGYTFPVEWANNALRAGPLPAPASIEGYFSHAGTLFGFVVGLAWLATRGGYQASGPIEKRAIRYVIGLIGVVLFWKGLDVIFPAGEDFIGYFFRYLRYSLVGLWISAGAPYLFFHFKLAEKPKM
ncbi:MAG: phosphatase PAP2 family protein [Anaerolineales bacterium]